MIAASTTRRMPEFIKKRFTYKRMLDRIDPSFTKLSLSESVKRIFFR